VKIKGKWCYLYRAVDSNGDTLDFILNPTRDKIAAKRFFEKALKSPHNKIPIVISVDKNIAYPPAIEKLKENKNLPEKVNLFYLKFNL
jgi:transposase, IS6 family